MIKAIETEYAGCRFRSRLEARWAVFFDRLGIRWEHEPEGFETSEGRYLPDFRIAIPQIKEYGQRQWFEVKPDGAPLDPRHPALARGVGQPVIVARGIPRNYNDQMRGWNSPLMAYGLEDKAWPVAFCDSTQTWRDESYCALGDNRHWCQEAMNLSLLGVARCHLGIYGEHETYTTYPPIEGPAIDAAYAAARSARFGT